MRADRNLGLAGRTANLSLIHICGQGSVEKYHDIHVVYTKEAETADAYIERATYEMGRRR